MNVERPESDFGGVGEKFLAMAAQVNETDAGDDAVSAALQLREHAAGVVEVGGFPEQGVLEGDEGIRAIAHEGESGNFFRDGAGLAVGVQLGDFHGGQLFGVEFRGIAGDDGEVESQPAQELGTAGRVGERV